MYKNNPEIHGYIKDPICESHAHLCFEKPIDETLDCYEKIIKHFNYRAVNLNAIPVSYGYTENFQTIYCKSKLSPTVYASAGPEYLLNGHDSEESLLNQIKEYSAMGFDGIKMLDGKVSQYRITKYKLNDPLFTKFFEYAEENGIPITLHVGDPERYWDYTKATPYTIEKGWVFGPDDPHIEELRSWVDDVLKCYPKLKLILAHFYFMSNDLERLSKMLDTYENLHLDITPGGEMFVNFTNNYDESRSFFEKYQHRILYGTDMYNTFDSPEKAEAEVGGPRVFQARSMLEKTEEFYSPLISDKPLKPFGFKGEILNNIYCNNFYNLFGENPKKLDYERIFTNCKDFVLNNQSLNSIEKSNMKIITEHFENIK